MADSTPLCKRSGTMPISRSKRACLPANSSTFRSRRKRARRPAFRGAGGHGGRARAAARAGCGWRRRRRRAMRGSRKLPTEIRNVVGPASAAEPVGDAAKEQAQRETLYRVAVGRVKRLDRDHGRDVSWRVLPVVRGRADAADRHLSRAGPAAHSRLARRPALKSRGASRVTGLAIGAAAGMPRASGRACDGDRPKNGRRPPG